MTHFQTNASHDDGTWQWQTFLAAVSQRFHRPLHATGHSHGDVLQSVLVADHQNAVTWRGHLDQAFGPFDEERVGYIFERDRPTGTDT